MIIFVIRGLTAPAEAISALRACRKICRHQCADQFPDLHARMSETIAHQDSPSCDRDVLVCDTTQSDAVADLSQLASNPFDMIALDLKRIVFDRAASPATGL